MKAKSSRRLVLAAAAMFCAMPAAHAQFAVIDVASVAQLVRELTTMQQQLVTLDSQLRQAQAQYAAMTGSRGMQNLLAGVNRNYLPGDWTSLMSARGGISGAYPALAASVESNVAANAVLTPGEVATLSMAEQAQLTDDRQNAALLEATVQQALATTSSRFADLSQLVSAIGTAADAKATLDLSARIGAEQAMVANDAAKLQVLYEAARAEREVSDQRAREAAVADIGSLRTLPPLAW